MDELERVKADIVEIRLEIKPLEKLPDKLDELIRLQQEFVHTMARHYVSENSCSERRKIADEKIEKLENLFGHIMKGVATTAIGSLGYLISLVLHK